MTLATSPCSHNAETMNSHIVAGVTLTEATYAPNLKVPKHFHAHAGFGLVLQGTYQENYRTMSLECKPRQIKFRPASETHSNEYHGLAVRCFFIDLRAEWFERMRDYAVTLPAPTVFKSNSLVSLVLRLRRESRQMDALSPLTIEGILLEIVAEASRNLVKISERKHPRWLIQARDLLHERFSERLTLVEIAESVGVHPVYLSTVFRQFYRCNLGEYLRRLRIEFACNQISMSAISLVDVAQAAGFSDQSQFSRTFKRITGLTPAQYRSSACLS